MELPEELRDALEKELAGRDTRALARDAQAISQRYRERNTAPSGPLAGTAGEAAAYAAARMPATYGAVYSALAWTLDCLDIPQDTPLSSLFDSLLDVGAGTGAAVWAADTLVQPKRILCLEREREMTRLGQKLMETGPSPLRAARWQSFDLAAGVLPEKASLVTAAYVLNELPEKLRERAALSLWEATEELLLLVEPGTPAGFALLRGLREPLAAAGAHIVAPCPVAAASGSVPCPMPEGDWCHFSCRVARSRLHRQLKGGDAPYEDEKFAYLALSRRPPRPAEDEGRVLRHPVINSGFIELELCGADGLSRRKVTKKDGPLWKRARKIRQGDTLG